MTEDRAVLSRPAAPAPLSVRYGAAPDQVADGWPGQDRRAADRPLVALVHGGFWRPGYDRTHLRPMAAALRDEGVSVASLEYRRLPGHPQEAARDVRAALALVPAALAAAGARHDGSVVLVGHSAGGHLALCAAAARAGRGPRGTLALAPVADLRLADRLDLDGGAVADFLGGPPNRFAPLDPVRLPPPRTPTVLVHGTADARVPARLTESYAAAHPAVRPALLPGVGHFELIDPLSAAWPAVVAELLALCRS